MKKFSIFNYKFKMGIGLFCLAILLSLGLSQPAKAATITTGPLEITFAGSQLFSETNMYPGMPAIIKSVSIKNNGIYPHSFSIAANGVSGSLANVLQIEPRDGGVAVWNQTLSQLASLPNGSKVIVPSIASGATKNIQIAAILPSNAGNGLQGQSATNFNFVFGDESTDQREPTGFLSLPPTLGQRITQRITYNPPATTGDQGVTGQPGIAGTGGTVSGAESDTRGTTTVAKSLCFWWLVIMVILIISLILYHRYIKEERPVFWWIWPVVIATALYFLQAYFDRSYQPTIFCQYFWALEALVLVIYFVLEIRMPGKPEKK